jgi:magnesium chelatase subunit D
MIVVDCESGFVRLGLAGKVARAAGTLPLTIDDLTAESLTAAVSA